VRSFDRRELLARAAGAVIAGSVAGRLGGEAAAAYRADPGAYTHLTLPTIRLV
jgi:hypothetical protein